MVTQLCDIENKANKSKEIIMSLQHAQTLEEFDEVCIIYII